MADKQTLEALLKKLEERMDQDPSFTTDEVNALREMVKAWRGWQSLGRATKWIVITLGLVAGGIAAAGSLADHVRAAIRSWIT